MITLASNDPSDPVQTFVVKGNGVGPDLEPEDTGPADIQEAGGCGCRAVGSDIDPGRRGGQPVDGSPAAFAAIALAGVLAARRRKRA